YKDAANIRLSCSRVQDQTAVLEKELQNPRRTNEIINTPVGQLVPPRVSSGFAENEASSRTYEQQYAEVNQISVEAAEATVRNSSKRAAEAAAQGQPGTKKRKKVERDGCAGRGSWFNCEHECRDCSQRSVKLCVGRSSRAANKRRCIPLSQLDLGSERAYQGCVQEIWYCMEWAVD
ncbi:hypothetical protein R3P38DRAFT_2534926, partial [Favolaschia claudopus]